MEAYASWIRRVAAYLIDHMLGLAIGVALGIVGGLIVAWAGGGARLQGVVGLIVNLAMLAYWIWNWGFRQGITGSTVGQVRPLASDRRSAATSPTSWMRSRTASATCCRC